MCDMHGTVTTNHNKSIDAEFCKSVQNLIRAIMKLHPFTGKNFFIGEWVGTVGCSKDRPTTW